MSSATPRGWLREPLLHFLAAGAGLFLIVGWLDPAPPREDVITVTKDDLLATLQGRARVYDEATFTAMLEQMPAEQRRALVHETVADEALYREGRKLSLAEIDPVVRQRIVQQMRILLLDEAASDLDVSDDEVRAYYEANRGDYAEAPAVSFTHVYFSADKHGAAAEAMARDALKRLNADHVPAERAGEYGDRYLYQTNYADADADRVAAEFGRDFADRLLTANNEDDWIGPVRSDYGWHAVRVTSREPAHIPAFDEIAGRAKEDALADRRRDLLDKVMERLLTRYEIRVEDGLERQ